MKSHVLGQFMTGDSKHPEDRGINQEGGELENCYSKDNQPTSGGRLEHEGKAFGLTQGFTRGGKFGGRGWDLGGGLVPTF